jgi:ATP-binding cassette subfamily B protein
MNRADLRLLLSYAAPYRLVLLASMAMMMAEGGLALAVPWLGGMVAQGLLEQQLRDTGTLLLMLLALFAVQALLKFGNYYVTSRNAEHILSDLRVRLYDHLQALPIGFYHQRRQGEILTLLTNDVDKLGGFITGTLLGILPLLITVAGALAFMFGIDPRLCAVAALLVPVFFLLTKIIGRRLRPLARQWQEAYAGLVGVAEENIGMLPAIKTFTREPLESARYREQARRLLAISAEQRAINAALGPGIQFLAAAGILLILWLAGESLSVGRISTPQLVTFLLYVGLLTRPVGALANVYGQMQSTRGSLERLMEVLTERPEPLLHPGRELDKMRGEIEYRDVRFAYPGRKPAVENLSLHIPAGETIAITGENGAGKSTLAHLLMRLYEPDAGNILLDGIEIRDISLPSLRRQIGVVPQHVLLFNGSVRDNIAYGRDNATQEDIEAAARAARAHDFITRLPQGYETFIGDRGVRLSGGQQQRIALARALLKDPPILILDEATAMFDPEGEREFLEECREVLKSRTVILITHRPASLALADRVIELGGGRLQDRDV